MVLIEGHGHEMMSTKQSFKVEFSREPSGESDPLKIFQPSGLTPREVELFPCLTRGKTTAEIGLILGIRPGTVTKHLDHIYTKLGVNSRIAAVVWFLEIMYQARKSKNAGFIPKSVKISESGSVVAPSTPITVFHSAVQTENVERKKMQRLLH